MRYYSNLAQEMTLTAGVAAGDTVLNLSSVTGLPSAFPFTLVIDPGASNEEVVTCTALFGTSATVQRGSDGTSATAHSAAAKVRHMLTKRDLSEPQEHIAATTDVHGTGAGSAVVGTTSIQTLTNKTLDGATNTFTNLPKASLPSDTVYTGATQTLTNKTLSNPTLTGTTTTGQVNVTSGGVTAAAGDLTAGDLTAVAARSWRNRAKNNNGKTYEYRISQDVNADPGLVYHVLYENGVEAGRFDLYNGTMRYRANATASFQNVQLVDDSTISSFLSTATGWTNAGTALRVRNGVAYLDIAFTRSGAAITATAGGGIADVAIATMNTGYRPDAWKTAAALYGGSAGGFCYLNTSGVVGLYHLAPSTDLATGDIVRASFIFPL